MPRRIIVAGGRDFTDRTRVWVAIDDHITSTLDTIIHGGCPTGADAAAKEYIETMHQPGEVFEANWKSQGRAAGPRRNREMAQSGNVLIAFWDGKSRGTRSMISEALNHGVEVHVYRYGPSRSDQASD